MDRFSRIVLGYHGCDPAFADALIRGETRIEEWRPSTNPYDWLGHGIYFWEHAPERARAWAHRGGVVGAVIQTGTCLDFTDIAYTQILSEQYWALSESYQREGRTLPSNHGKRRELDCLVINELLNGTDTTTDRGIYDTARCPFLEGEPAYPGSGILRESHMQLVVLNRRSILGVFRPNLALAGE